MNPIHITSTQTSPKVTLDKTSGALSIEGVSNSEDPAEFYQPIIDWLKKYAEDPNPETMLILKIEAFNDDSTKPLLETLGAIEFLDNLIVKWYYQENNELMKEAGEDFSEMLDITFEFETFETP